MNASVILLLISSMCYSADVDFLSFQELVIYINELNEHDIKKYCANNEALSLMAMIKAASFDPVQVKSYVIDGDRRYGMCDIVKGIHVLIHFDVTEDKKYQLKSIEACR